MKPICCDSHKGAETEECQKVLRPGKSRLAFKWRFPAPPSPWAEIRLTDVTDQHTPGQSQKFSLPSPSACPLFVQVVSFLRAPGSRVPAASCSVWLGQTFQPRHWRPPHKAPELEARPSNVVSTPTHQARSPGGQPHRGSAAADQPVLWAHHADMSPGGLLRFLFPLWLSPSSSRR